MLSLPVIDGLDSVPEMEIDARTAQAYRAILIPALCRLWLSFSVCHPSNSLDGMSARVSSLVSPIP